MPNLYKKTWVVWTVRNNSCFKLGSPHDWFLMGLGWLGYRCLFTLYVSKCTINTRFWNNSEQEEWFCQTGNSGLFCGHHCLSSFIELDDGKIHRKSLYLMVKTMVSCKFSLNQSSESSSESYHVYAGLSALISSRRERQTTSLLSAEQRCWGTVFGVPVFAHMV